MEWWFVIGWLFLMIVDIWSFIFMILHVHDSSYEWSSISMIVHIHGMVIISISVWLPWVKRWGLCMLNDSWCTNGMMIFNGIMFDDYSYCWLFEWIKARYSLIRTYPKWWMNTCHQLLLYRALSYLNHGMVIHIIDYSDWWGCYSIQKQWDYN